MIKKTTAFAIVMVVMILTALAFGKLGEYHVIREQRIETTDTGYLVDFEGNYYEYLAD
jgi:hypothetical protein